MAKIAAIEFDDQLARVLVAKISGNSFQLSSAFEVELEAGWEDPEADFGKVLTKALGNRVGRCDALVSMGRGQSELRVINVPLVPADELPEIVRFQAMRQFSNAAEDAPVDFLPLSENENESRVLAATIPRESVKRMVASCQTAGLNVKAIKLRATCTTALAQSINSDRKNYIIVEPSDKSFNLEVVAYGKLCLTRTVRAASGETNTQIVRDIRRTLAAANNQIAGYEAKQIVVFGKEENFAGLRTAIENDLHIDIEFIDPFDHAGGLESPPENTGAYASLVGLLTSQCSSATETIDFLNCRKKEKKQGTSRAGILAGIAAAILVVGVVGLGYLMLSQKSSRIAEIRRKIQAQAQNDKIAKETIGDVEKIEAFENNQAVWLKELSNLSERAMDPDQLILNDVTFTLDLAKKTGGIKTEGNGFLQSGAVSEQLANRIRESDAYDATLENVVLLSEKEKTQDIYTHKFKARVYRAPQLLVPEVAPDKLAAYMEPRIAAGQKEIEAARKLRGNGIEPGSSMPDEDDSSNVEDAADTKAKSNDNKNEESAEMTSDNSDQKKESSDE